MNVLSLFDGMSCLQIALNRIGVKPDVYYASEIDKHAIKVTQHNFPDTIQLGDVTKVSGHDLPRIDFLGAGSPCQGFSFAGKGLNFEDPRSKLFFEFVRILKECREKNPNIMFLLENVQMKQEHELVISRLLGVNPIWINSALVSAQNRLRGYWTNIGLEPSGLFGDLHSIIQQPKDKGILLKDILQDEVDEKYFLSERGLARIKRKVYSNPKVDPEKTGSLNTKNNSGQLSVDSGTTLITDNAIGRGVDIRRTDKGPTLRSHAGCSHDNKIVTQPIQVDSIYEGNATAGRVYSPEGKGVTLKGEAGGGGAKMGLVQVGVVNDRGTLREADEKSMAIDANFHNGMDNHGQRTMITVHNSMPRTGGKKPGGTGPLSRSDGKTYGLNTNTNTNTNQVELRTVRQLNDSKESGGQQPYQQNRVYDGDGIAPACQAQLPQGSYAFQIDQRIRRLTPVECCRLQTVPDVVELTTFVMCLDQARNFVNVVRSNPRLLTCVLSAQEKEPYINVFNAVRNFLIRSRRKENIAPPNASPLRQGVKTKVGSINPEEPSLTVDTVGRKTMSNYHWPEENSVTCHVFISSIEGKITIIGEGVLVTESNLIHHQNGSFPLDWFGHEINQHANFALDATKMVSQDSTRTILSRFNTQNIEQMLIILFCCAESVIGLSTQEKTQNDSLSVSLSFQRNYFEGTGVSETAQYRMLGNGWTIDAICHLLKYLKL